MTDVIVIGGGYAGLTAALYIARAGRKALVFESENIGGQITAAHQIENYPGYPSISGMELADNLYMQATAQGVEVRLEQVLSVELESECKKVTTEDDVYVCGAVIIATGAKHRKLGVAREEDLTSNGISYCAVCDGMFYKDKDVAVIGGGNTAFGDALFLASICRNVTIIHRRDSFRADAAMTKRASAVQNIHYMTGYTVQSFLGESLLTGLKLQHTASQELTEINVDGLFVAVGHEPKNPKLPDGISVDRDGYLLAGEDMRTNIPGIFVAGDCRAKEVRQLTTAASDGTNAAIAAVCYLQD
jgi:thioredoxin reductase (NADPH)